MLFVAAWFNLNFIQLAILAVNHGPVAFRLFEFDLYKSKRMVIDVDNVVCHACEPGV